MQEHAAARGRHRYKNKRRVLFRKYNKKLSFFLRYLENLTATVSSRVVNIEHYHKIGNKVLNFHHEHSFFTDPVHKRYFFKKL